LTNEFCFADDPQTPLTARVMCVLHVVVRAVQVSVEENPDPATAHIRSALKSTASWVCTLFN
jgi:hypothetical protein